MTITVRSSPRALARLASVMGAALLAGSRRRQWHKTRPPTSPRRRPRPPAASPKPSSSGSTLKTALKITPAQDSKWQSVAQAMRDNASRMEKLVAEKRKIPPEKTTAVDDLKTYQEFTETRLDGLKHLTSAFKSLYDSMTAEQKKNADLVFEQYGPSRPPSRAKEVPMTRSKRLGLAAALGALALGLAAVPASAAWWGNGPVAPRQPLPLRQPQQPVLRLSLSRAAGDLLHAVQLRLRAAPGGLRQHAGVLDHDPAVMQQSETAGRKARRLHSARPSPGIKSAPDAPASRARACACGR